MEIEIAKVILFFHGISDQIQAYYTANKFGFILVWMSVTVAIGLFGRSLKEDSVKNSGFFHDLKQRWQQRKMVNQYNGIPASVTFCNPNPSPQVNQQKAVPVGPSIYYHGGPMDGVMDIYRNGRIRLGASNPKGFWMSPSFDTAASYAGSKGNGSGGIVELQIDNDVVLTDRKGGYFVLEIPPGVNGEYWTFDSGVYPVAVYDLNRNRIS